MSFKLPKEFEPLEFSPISSIDKIKDNDLLIIPSEKDAPKLRVTLSTLRSWGLSVTSSTYTHRYGCCNYSAVRQAFGTPFTMRDSTDADAGMHVYMFKGIHYDNNKSFNNASESIITYENANSISDSRETIETPDLPFMSATLNLFKPLHPYDRAASNENKYPETLTQDVDRRAYEMLVNYATRKSLPTSRLNSMLNTDREAFTDLPYFLEFVSQTNTGFSSEFSKFLNEGTLSEINGGAYFTNRYVSSSGASRVIITAPHNNDSDSSQHMRVYFPYNSYKTDQGKIKINRQFLENIIRRGAVVFRSEKVQEIASKIMAHAVAENMADRYGIIIQQIKKYLQGLTDELPQIQAIQQNFKNASGKLQIDEKTIKTIRKFF